MCMQLTDSDIIDQLCNIDLSSLDDKRFLEHLSRVMSAIAHRGILISVKTCKHTIRTGVEKYPTRTGNFVFNKDEHIKLCMNNGIYIFIVKHNNVVIHFWAYPAKDIYYQTKIMWTRLIPEVWHG